LEFENNIIKVCPDRVRLCGKQFNRAVRALIMVNEALRSLWLSAFFQWCEVNGIVNPLPDPVRTDLYN
jgi:hypothetical protein